MSGILFILAVFIFGSWVLLRRVCPKEELKMLGMNFIPPLVAVIYTIAGIYYLF